MIYLDHAASTTVFPSIVKGLSGKATLSANPSSVHQAGIEARSIIDQARYDMGKILRAKLENIIFTSGATEALHLAIIGNYLARRQGTKPFNILMSPIMHSAVFEAVNFLQYHFNVSVAFLPLDAEGFIALKKVSEEYLSDFDMVICEHGNSEVGLLQPVAKLGKMIRRIEGDRPVFVVDTAASVVDTDISLDHQVCDALVLSAEKFGGLKGSGVLISDTSFEIKPLIGGSQEFGYRGGTENVVGIWAMAEALKQHTQERNILVEQWNEFYEILNNFFIQNFKNIRITTPQDNKMSHIFHFILPQEKGSVFVQQCDLKGVALSSGSACSSGSVGGSKVLKAIGFSDEESERGVRISFGRDTTRKEIERTMKVLESVL